ncbi:hypothetical protein [Nocardia noduli]|nr:hypothetical protein [Nocardia noduli]
MTAEQVAASTAAIIAFSAGAARGHRAAAIELGELYGCLDEAPSPMVGVR